MEVGMKKELAQSYRLRVGGALVLSFALCALFAILGCAVAALPFVWVYAGATLLLALYQLLSSRCYFKLLCGERVQVARFYMVHFILRFVFAGVLLVVFIELEPSCARALTWSFLVLFLVILVVEAMVFVNTERKLSNE